MYLDTICRYMGGFGWNISVPLLICWYVVCRRGQWLASLAQMSWCWHLLTSCVSWSLGLDIFENSIRGQLLSQSPNLKSQLEAYVLEIHIPKAFLMQTWSKPDAKLMWRILEAQCILEAYLEHTCSVLEAYSNDTWSMLEAYFKDTLRIIKTYSKHNWSIL